MALSSPASDTAVSATSTPDADLSSALGMLAMQDPSIPTSGKCHIDRCAVETLIQVAESLDYKGLCSLSRASKRYTEAAQDVLYRVVDLRPGGEDWENWEDSDNESTFDQPTKSALAVFLWTIKQKPHLAPKVQDLWFLPRSTLVEYPQLMYSGVSPVALMSKPRSYVVEVNEKKLACDLLARLTELRSLTITALDEFLCRTEFDDPDNYVLPYLKVGINKTVFGRLSIPLNKLVALPCFSKLTSIHLSHGYLDWQVVTLPTLHTLCIGIRAKLPMPSVNAEAPNITSLTLEAEAGGQDSRFLGATTFLRCLPNVHTLTLGSYLREVGHPRFPRSDEDRFRCSTFGNTGSFSKRVVQALLFYGFSVENLIFKYAEPVHFGDDSTVCLDVRTSGPLQRIQIAECALVDSHNFQRLEGSSPSHQLPRRIRSLVITHPRSPGPDDGDHKSKLTSWLGELTKTDFLDLERVEVVCSVGYGDDIGFKQRLEQSAEVRYLKTIGVAVVVRKE
ncbi:uncharacterized protein J4E88_005764 [Alternaria novae-zelandiae]|uniref:uncharacterized protein n=1 Tax=Alternaria novae-zelandiae TaxID=430562 RepID=UPI0020C57339|nr:uncharacterized protein J4E88_005764 [Alternaria novae-zelandiae]KAI4681256.1 hypothetical protein J4E88_005764 [Alternaria novae-zelandiae]